MIIYGDKIFKNPIEIISAFNNLEFKKAFKKIEEYRRNYYLAGYIRYEAKDIFLGKIVVNSLPLLYFEVFDTYENYISQKSKDIRLNPHSAIEFGEYSDALNKIKTEISNGNTYEVNYTYDFDVDFDGNAKELYDFLLTKQKTPYNMFLQNDYDTFLSFSPELFFELERGHIMTKPMKGTVQRGLSIQEDLKLINFLQNDEKNRAENVMIVDLLRNDLGKIAKTGSVKVSKLFDVETHATLHQMTSQIEADLSDEIDLYEIFRAIFPCGSITGAPKISTMKIIEAVEKGKREIYCGAAGLITPSKITFSVPIRCLQKSKFDKFFRYRVGGAIVWDSQTQEEWEETLTKTKFLNNNFRLIETMKVENGKIIFKEEHFNRLKKSAKSLNFCFDEKISSLKAYKDGILRILLSKNGEFTTECKPLVEINTNKVKISAIKIDSNNEMVYYKTTYRPWFSESYSQIKNGEIYDEIFFNKKGELTEGSRSNIVLELDGELFTPPTSCGILNGIYRQKMLDENQCTEKIIYKSDLLKARNIYCVNSVRGVKKVELI